MHFSQVASTPTLLRTVLRGHDINCQFVMWWSKDTLTAWPRKQIKITIRITYVRERDTNEQIWPNGSISPPPPAPKWVFGSLGASNFKQRRTQNQARWLIWLGGVTSKFHQIVYDRDFYEDRTNIEQLFDEEAGMVSIEGNDFVVVNLRRGGAKEQ